MTAIKERPILFSGAMVRALLAGTKTQTRRVVKPKIGNGTFDVITRSDNGDFVDIQALDEHGVGVGFVTCPYGQPGDRLWVRETCKAAELQDGTDGVHYVADGRFEPLADNEDAVERWLGLYHYRKLRGATVPPIHMPRWASRILLGIVSVRVERLHDISEADAQAEGAERGILRPYGINDWQLEHNQYASYKEGFQYIWHNVNGTGSWQANPWVWVVEFKRL